MAQKANAGILDLVENGFHITWSTHHPVLAIDHIWVNDKIKTKTANLQWSDYSDHLPYTATFDTP